MRTMPYTPSPCVYSAGPRSKKLGFPVGKAPEGTLSTRPGPPPRQVGLHPGPHGHSTSQLAPQPTAELGPLGTQTQRENKNVPGTAPSSVPGKELSYPPGLYSQEGETIRLLFKFTLILERLFCWIENSRLV